MTDLICGYVWIFVIMAALLINQLNNKNDEVSASISSMERRWLK